LGDSSVEERGAYKVNGDFRNLEPIYGDQTMTQSEILEFLSAHKLEFEEKFGVIKIGLFGSYVRGEARDDSDIDIAVELKQGNIADEYFRLLHYLEDNLHKKIDLGILSNIKPALQPYILKEIVYV
jgi:predicted nucleotidyltransferase